MSDNENNTIVFGQKTIDELIPYDVSQDGQLITNTAASTAKFPIYINQTDTSTLKTTKSINLVQLQELIQMPSEQQSLFIMKDSDLNEYSENYQAGMLITPKVFKENTENMINNKAPSISSFNTLQNQVNNFNLKNGNKIGSLRTIGSTTEGTNNYSLGQNAFAEGSNTRATGNNSHAEGQNTTAIGRNSHAFGLQTLAYSANQIVFGKYNKDTINDNKVLILGNGTDENNRNDSLTIDWDGSINTEGDIISSGNIIDGDHNILANKANSSDLARVATTGSYNDLINKPTLPNNNNIIDLIYPIGSIFITLSNENPGTVWPGTEWQRIIGKFLLASSGNQDDNNGIYQSVGNTGGESSVTLTAEQSGLPRHQHDFTQPSINSLTITSGPMSANSSIDHQHNGVSYVSSQQASGYGLTQSNAFKNKVMVLAPTNSQGIHNGTDVSRYTRSIAHTHSITFPNITASGGQVNQKTAQNAAVAHNNIPPFLSVNVWQRIS